MESFIEWTDNISDLLFQGFGMYSVLVLVINRVNPSWNINKLETFGKIAVPVISVTALVYLLSFFYWHALLPPDQDSQLMEPIFSGREFWTSDFWKAKIFWVQPILYFILAQALWIKFVRTNAWVMLVIAILFILPLESLITYWIISESEFLSVSWEFSLVGAIIRLVLSTLILITIVVLIAYILRKPMKWKHG